MLTDKAAIAANRFGLGARPRDVTPIGRDPVPWLEAQLAAVPAAAPTAPTAPAARPASATVLAEVRDLQLVRQLVQRQNAQRRGAQPPAQPSQQPSQPPARRRAAQAQPERRAGGAAATPAVDADAVRDFATFVREQYATQVAERRRRAIETDAPFVERLMHFWSNH